MSLADNPLTIVLQHAVPLWIAEANQRHGEVWAELLADWRRDAGPVIGAKGDLILYRGGKRGESANAFNHLARGLAALACHQGGVHVFGLLWCAEHSPAGTVPTTPPVCAQCLEKYPDGPKGCPCCTVLAECGGWR